jgi:hypothetical protein
MFLSSIRYMGYAYGYYYYSRDLAVPGSEA